MSNKITTPPPSSDGFDDDGFSFSSSSGRGRNFLRWNAEDQWTDRDGCEAPSPMLAVKAEELLRMWKDDRATDITTRPLPDPAELNAAIPQSEWEKDKDGKPRPPWAHHIAIYLVEPNAGTMYVYCAATTGAHIAFEQLRDNVATMRMLRNGQVVPLVRLSSRPMKTKFGMSERPHFEIVGWHSLGGGGEALAPPTTPQLPGPGAAERPPATTEAPPTQPSERKEDAISSGFQPWPKPQPQLKPQLRQQENIQPSRSRRSTQRSTTWRGEAGDIGRDPRRRYPLVRGQRSAEGVTALRFALF